MFYNLITLSSNFFKQGPGLPPGGHSLDGSDQGTPVSTDSDCSTSEAGPSLSGRAHLKSFFNHFQTVIICKIVLLSV